jgi:hypothetical protein
MPGDPLTRAEIQIFNVSESSSPAIRITGLVGEQWMELEPEVTVVLAAGEQPARKRKIIVPKVLKPAIVALRVATRTRPMRGLPLRLTREELAELAPDEPVIIENIGSTLDLRAFDEVAEQAANTNRSLVIIAHVDEHD